MVRTGRLAPCPTAARRPPAGRGRDSPSPPLSLPPPLPRPAPALWRRLRGVSAGPTAGAGLAGGPRCNRWSAPPGAPGAGGAAGRHRQRGAGGCPAAGAAPPRPALPSLPSRPGRSRRAGLVRFPPASPGPNASAPRRYLRRGVVPELAPNRPEPGGRGCCPPHRAAGGAGCCGAASPASACGSAAARSGRAPGAARAGPVPPRAALALAAWCPPALGAAAREPRSRPVR